MHCDICKIKLEQDNRSGTFSKLCSICEWPVLIVCQMMVDKPSFMATKYPVKPKTSRSVASEGIGL